jgi:hypothetical protein
MIVGEYPTSVNPEETKGQKSEMGSCDRLGYPALSTIER